MEQAIVGLGGQAFMRPNSQDAIREFRPCFDKAPVYSSTPSASGLSRNPRRAHDDSYGTSPRCRIARIRPV
jgi:hypothetical protein